MHCLNPEQIRTTVDLGTHTQLCAFIKQLFETNSLATAMHGLHITELLLRPTDSTSRMLLQEMYRHGLAPAIANLKTCREKQRSGLMRTLSGTTRPDSVSKVAARVMSIIETMSNEASSDDQSQGAVTMKRLSELATALSNDSAGQEQLDQALSAFASQVHEATPYELHTSRLPCVLLTWLSQASTSEERWQLFENSRANRPPFYEWCSRPR